MRSSGRPLLAVALAAALIAGLVAVPGTASAVQDPNTTVLRPTKWLSTDARTPFRAITTGDARVGSWRDEHGHHHISKSYFTFDLTGFKGTTVFTAVLNTHETSVNDCGKPRAVELWTTDPRETITWAFQPRELVKAPDPRAGTPCEDPRSAWDLGEIVKKAVADGRASLTLVIRIARGFQGDVSHGRSLSTDPELVVTSNSPPGTPTDLKVDNRSCAQPVTTASRRPFVSAALSDADGTNGLVGRLAFWPLDAPDQRVEHTAVGDGGVVGGYFPADLVQDGRQFAFAARTEDGHADSAWSAPCLITADFTGPANPPTVTSAVYREDAGPPGDGGVGVPGEFTFSAGGDQDVVAFDYEGGRVAADQPGGSATVTVTPTAEGAASIEVHGVDRAGNRSPGRSYRYFVRTTAPQVALPVFELGRPGDVVFTATQEGATAFWYIVDNREAQQVSVGADGTARDTVTFYEAADRHAIKVWTVNRGGVRSGVTELDLHVQQYEPTVYVDRYDIVVGEKVVVTAKPRYPREGVHTYVFQVGDENEVRVPVNADGSARYEYTTTRPGDHRVRAASVNWSYVRSGWGEDHFTVTAPGPVVSSTDYPSGRESGGPGVTGTFTFAPAPRLPVAEYRYEFSDGQQGKAVPGRDGTVSVRWTPGTPGGHWVRVSGVSLTGAETERVSYSFEVGSSPPTAAGSRIPPVPR
ncbi:MAG: hypothetical protein HOY78_10900 [Saccharothrix sp.]|nr:hypothetical protein [Saccharothrix sp.]